MKKIAIVSNNPKQPNMSEFVDGCDEVIRFSRCATYGENTGSKITTWVTRSLCHHTECTFGVYKSEMSQPISCASKAYIVHGFPEYNAYGQIIGQEIVKYDTQPVSQLRPLDGIECIPINARGVTLLHPGYNPTLGFMFLWNILANQWFVDDKIYLVGFDFVGIDAPHKADWEQRHVQEWVKRDWFQRI